MQFLDVNQRQAVTQRQAAAPGGLLARREPRSPGSACHGGRSSDTGLVLENIFSLSVLKSLNPKRTLQKGIAAPGS